MMYNKNQKLLLLNAGTWSVFDALTSAFLVAFALLFGASNFVVGLLGAMPYLVSFMIEIPGAKLTEFFSRKKICNIAQTISRTSWALIILVPYFFKESPLLFLTLFFAWIKITDLITEPAWISLIADIVPLKIRGRFFGTRNAIGGISAMISAIIGGFYLDLFAKNDTTGFATMFAFGILFALASVVLQTKIKEPTSTDHTNHSLKDFFSINGDFKKFCYFAVFFNFSVMLASPFFAVFMLKNLNLSYSYFMLASGISTLARILSQHRIGVLCDKFGDRQIALISVFGTAFVPFMFLFVTPQTLWLLIIAQIISGIVWAGADLTLFNLLLDLTKPEKRASQIAAYAMIVSIPNIAAPVIGGLIGDYAQIYVLQGIPLIFTISFLLRLFTAVPLYAIHEPRAQRVYPFTHVFLHAFTLHPSRGLDYRIRLTVQKIKNKYGLLR